MSKTFKLQFSANNDAFAHDQDAEVVRILRQVANRIEEGDSYDMFRNIFDIDGNIIGTFAMKESN